MFRRFKSRSRAVLGVDICPTSVKIMVVSTYGEKCCIEAYGYERLPPNSNSISEINTLTSTVQKLLAENKISTKLAALAVPDSSVISKTIQLLGSLTDLELEELAFLEAKKSLVYSADEISVDFVVLGPSNEFCGMLDVLLFASRTETINKRVAAIKGTGLKVNIVDIESYAIARVIELVFAKTDFTDYQTKIIAVIDIGYQFTRLCIMDAGRIIYTREETFGFKQLLDAVVQYYKVSFTEAQDLLEQEGMPENYVEDVLQPFMDLILLHIKRNLQYFFTTSHYELIDHIYLAGEFIDLDKLASTMQDKVGVSTSVANPLQHIAVASNVNLQKLRRLAPSFLIALGLALGQLK